MKLLLDTNVLIWWLGSSRRVTGRALEAIASPDNIAYVSVASAWELAIKVALGRLELPGSLVSWLSKRLDEEQFTILPINLAHVLSVEALPLHHGDPFDRLLIAQAMAEGCWIVTADRIFHHYDVRIIDC